jgi:hypothetical protein
MCPWVSLISLDLSFVDLYNKHNNLKDLLCLLENKKRYVMYKYTIHVSVLGLLKKFAAGSRWLTPVILAT